MTKLDISPDWGMETDGALTIAGVVIATPRDMTPDGRSIEEGRANIRLMAAAPDLARAVEDFIAGWKRMSGTSKAHAGDLNAALKAARAAIAKATGETACDRPALPISDTAADTVDAAYAAAGGKPGPWNFDARRPA